MRRIQNYIKGVFTEMKKVTWPNAEELKGATIAVITFSIFAGVLVFAIDYAFTNIMSSIGL